MASGPDKAGTCQHCQMARAWRAGRKGVRKESALRLSSVDRLKSSGYGPGRCAPARVIWAGNFWAGDLVPAGPWSRVAGMQTKLHCWAAADPDRKFDDLFNFVHDPATLIVAFDRHPAVRAATGRSL